MSDLTDTAPTDAASIPNRDLPAALDELLTEAVREATGTPEAQPRPGQQKLAHDILRAMINATSVGGGVVDDPSVGQVLGQAGTGVGKSLAYLAPAMLMSLARGHRSVVSTESLSLQAQILDKDAPTVASAAARLYGRAPVARVLKGWSNYVCAANAAATATEVLDREEKPKVGDSETAMTRKEDMSWLREALKTTREAGEGQIEKLLAEVVAQKLTRPQMERLVAELVVAGKIPDDLKKFVENARGTDLSPSQLSSLADRIDALVFKQARRKRKISRKIHVDGEEMDRDSLLPLLSWALRSHLSEDDEGIPSPFPPMSADRHSYDGKTDGRTWETVSITPSSCPGAEDCPFGEVCAPNAARKQAAAADLVVTNHAMLAVQAARAVPVVIGSPKLGGFDHLVVDEAHTLASSVRGQGARAIGSRRLQSVGKSLKKVSAAKEDVLEALMESCRKIGVRLDSELANLLQGSSVTHGQGGTMIAHVRPDDDPLSQVGELLENWLEEARSLVPSESSMARHDLKSQIKVRRVSGTISEFLDDIAAARKHVVGQARWVELERNPGQPDDVAVKLSPVDVSGMLRDQLYTADVPMLFEKDRHTGKNVPQDWALPEYRWYSKPALEDPTTGQRLAGDVVLGGGADRSLKRIPPRYRLSVSHVSATLATSHRFDNGLDVAAKDYESPFAAAYGSSALYVPRAVTPEDLEDLTSRRYGKASFDTSKHADWAASHVVQLVAANDGSALVLASTVRAGQLYAQHLRSAPATKHLPVFSQWDGPPVRHLLADWKADHQAVMVGTKSLMTGVDAPGQTCTLVVVDRNPRAAGNPVDDARVESVMERAGLDKWSADRHVYVADSALLLTQAAGRLIRGVTDSGMVAVLDPRLLKSGPLSMKNRTAREDLMAPLGKFATKIADLHLATEWLAEHRAAGRVEDGTVEEGAA